MGRFTLPYGQVFDESGNLGAGFLLYFYQTGTSTLLNTYSDSGRTVANTNPVVADAEGRFGAIFLLDQPYKAVLRDEAGSVVWTADPCSSAVGELGLPLPIASGGTGATSVPGIFTALGLGDAATYTIGDGADEVPTNSMVAGVPTGGIILWYSSAGSIPTGWHACDGGTYSKSDGSGSITVPDLRDRFVIGATLTYGQGSSGGSAAGATTGASGALSLTAAADGDHQHSGNTDGHTLTTAEMPSHRHDITQGGNYNINNVVSTNSSGSNNTAGANTTVIGLTGGGGSHSHGISAAGTHTHTISGGDHTHSISGGLPPYYALIYICKL